MKRIWLALVLGLMSTGSVQAQEMMALPANVMEFHSYTYQVKDDGSAKVWLRIDSVVIPLAGGEYKLTLPEKLVGEASAWYRENGCTKYRGEICVMYGSNNWKEAKVARSGDELTIVIPKRSVLKPQDDQPITLGINWSMSDITTKKWWGREVEVVSAKASQFVPNLNIGVYFPDGVSFRDKQVGPGGWGQVVSEVMGKNNPMMESPKLAGMTAPYIFDSAGIGVMSRYTNNVSPGEEYKFKVMTSAVAWKMYTKEIFTGMRWILAIALVLALLLYMVVGKRSLLWYGGVVLLLTTLLILCFGLVLSYNFSFGNGRGDYPGPMMKETGAVDAQEVKGMPVPQEVGATEVVVEPEMSVEQK